MPRSTRPTLIVDADLILHRAAARNTEIKRCDENGDWWEHRTNVAQAYDDAEITLESARSELGCDRVILAYSMAPNWRHGILASYKSNRKETPKPPGFQFLKDKFRESEIYEVVEKPGLEGDDVLGILMTETQGLIEGPRIMWSDDKDLHGIPGQLYQTDRFVIDITEAEADWWHMAQTLTGDVVDGYKGCPGVGPVAAERILGPRPSAATSTGPSAPRSYWGPVVDAYRKAGLTEDDALVQARVARILRATDYNFETKEVIQWTPKE